MKIYVDADACPKAILEIIYKASKRLNVKIVLVSDSYFKHSTSELVEFVQVQQGADSADNYIIDNCVEYDIVIADDIPLARECIRKNASVIGKRGELFDDNNISARLSTRDLMEDLRHIGAVSGGPKPFSDKDKAKFSNTFDRILTKNMKLSYTKVN